MAHQSLYRRYRPQRFSEVRGQEQVIGALRSAVAEGRVGHAYLFSGPRGTGKTSTARILAKALNCEDLQDGEPCGVCAACVAMQAGTSYDLQELDAASNNKVEDVRALVERVALGSPGRTKVYILDEVHMLSTGASNALLKTLEEPPEHVVFVLATTDPQKVLPTIRSRTQHYEFHLLPAHDLAEHVRWVIADAGLSVDDAAVEHVLRAGGGSARDTLSALDQAAAGGMSDTSDHAEALTEAVVAVDTAAALTAVAEATIAGRDPRVLGEDLLAHLRDIFLHRMGGPQGHLSDAARDRVAGWAGRIGDRAVTRGLEEVGEALLAMRQAPDPRIPLEVALVRITRVPGADAAAGAGADLSELVARIERLEKGAPEAPPPAEDGMTGAARARASLAQRGTSPPADAGPRAAPTPPPASPPPTAGAPPPPSPAPVASAAPVASPAPPPEAPAPEPEPEPAPAAPSGEAAVDHAGRLWIDVVVPGLKGLAKALFAAGTVVAADDRTVTVGVPNAPHRERCEAKRGDAEAALSAALGHPVRLVLTVDDRAEGDRPAEASTASRPAPTPEPEADIDLDALVDAPTDQRSGVDRVTDAFPGAQVLDDR